MNKMNPGIITSIVVIIIMAAIITWQSIRLDKAQEIISDQYSYIASQDGRLESLKDSNDIMRGAIRDMTSHKRGELKLIGDYDLSHYVAYKKTGAAGIPLTCYKSVAVPADVKAKVPFGSTLVLVYPDQEIEIVSVDDYCPTDGRIDMLVASEVEAKTLGVVKGIKVYQIN